MVVYSPKYSHDSRLLVLTLLNGISASAVVLPYVFAPAYAALLPSLAVVAGLRIADLIR